MPGLKKADDFGGDGMKKRWAEITGILLWPLLCLTALEGMARGILKAVWEWMTGQPLMAGLNYLFLLGLCLMISHFRSRRVRVCLGLAVMLLCAVLGMANYYKLIYRLEPILVTDVTQIHEALETMGGMDFHFDMGKLWTWVIGTAVLMAAAILLLKQKRERRWLALPLAGLMLAVGTPFLCTYELAGGGNRYDMVDQTRHDGCLYTAFAAENYRHSTMRVDYSQEKTEAAYRALEAETPTQTAQGEEIPNVILVLSESFTDQEILGQYLDFTTELTPYYNQLQQESRHGKIYVPKVGGGTSETEFEVLTGLKSQYTVNPYSMGLPEMNSLASVLREKGLTATALHWYAGVYYNRYENLAKEGFESFYTTDTTQRDFTKVGMFISDRDHFRAIMDKMDETPERDFVFCLTMQNHGGYGYDDFRKIYGAEVPFTNELSEESLIAANNYCYLLTQTDAALAEWIEELRSYPEPVMVIFFGDHLAPLGMETYEELGVPIGSAAAHEAPYFIWSNRENLAGEEDMMAWQLGAYALTLAGLNDDPFFSYVERLRQQGVTEDETYDLLSYDALFGKQYAYRLAELHPMSSDYAIGGQMELEGFDTAEVGDRVYVRARLKDPTQKFRLSVDGVLRDDLCLNRTDEKLTLQCVLQNGYGRRYNQSREAVFDGTDGLLQASGRIGYETEPVWESGYSIQEDRWYRPYVLVKSEETFESEGVMTLLAEEECWGWQPSYGLHKAKQYGLDGQGHLVLAIPRKELAEVSREGVQAYLREKQAVLVRERKE